MRKRPQAPCALAGQIEGKLQLRIAYFSPMSRRYKNSLDMQFVLVPKGKFLMGGGGGNAGTKEVTIAHDFYLGQYEVTQWEWMQLMVDNPSGFKDPPAGTHLSKEDYWKCHPVENVTWEDCQEFAKRLNE